MHASIFKPDDAIHLSSRHLVVVVVVVVMV